MSAAQPFALSDIEDFIEDFFQREAAASTVRQRTSRRADPPPTEADHANFQRACAHMDACLTPSMRGNDPGMQGVFGEPEQPRVVFKISAYTHPEHGPVWVVFASKQNPSAGYRSLSSAFFVLVEQGGLRVAAERMWSDFESDGEEYTWEPLSGWDSLDFPQLEGPSTVERHLEPVMDPYGGLEQYQAEI